jgi:C4-dicarboxylate transporter DctM subunit
MAPPVIGLIAFFGLLLLVLVGLPVGFGMIVAGIVVFWAIGGWNPMLGVVGMVPFDKVTTYTFTCVPLFILMGNFAFRAGLAKDLYHSARLWTAKLPGGLAQATCLANAFFGALSGSTLAATATFSKLAVPEMAKLGYNRRLNVGCVAAAGTFASVIPPSINVVLYGMITEQSIGKMLIAGIIPGIVIAGCYMALIWVRVKHNPNLAGTPITGVTLKDAVRGSKLLWPVIVTFIVMLGGIYTGTFTPTEGGAVGAGVVFALIVITKRFSWHLLWDCLFDTAKTMAVLYIIVVGAFTFSAAMAITRLPSTVANWMVDLPFPPIIILFVILAVYIVLGCIMDTTAMLFLTMPVIFPTTVKLGFNPIWFGILIIHVFEIGMVSPPYGLSLFAAKASLPDVPFSDIMLGVIPFLLADLVSMSILIMFPQLVTFLPNLVMD